MTSRPRQASSPLSLLSHAATLQTPDDPLKIATNGVVTTNGNGSRQSATAKLEPPPSPTVPALKQRRMSSAGQNRRRLSDARDAALRPVM